MGEGTGQDLVLGVLVVVSVLATVPVSVLMSAFRVASALAPAPEAALCFKPLSA